MTMQPTVTPAPAAPAPVITYVPAINGPKIYERYLGRQSVGLGIAQIIIGVLCIIFNGICVGYVYYYNYGVVGHGFWCGILFIITGGFGIGAGTRKTLCQIVAFMVLNIISASFTIALLTVGILGATYASERGQCSDYYGYGYSYDCYENNYRYYPCYKSPCSQMKVAIAMESCLAIFGLIEAIVAIWGSALCCRSGACCCSKSTPAVHMMPGGYMPNNGQIIYITQTQGGQYTYSPEPVMPYPQGVIAPPSYATSYSQPGWGGQPPMAGSGVTVVTQEPPAYAAMSSSPTVPTGQPANQSPADQKY